jgi:hypothetical protein
MAQDWEEQHGQEAALFQVHIEPRSPIEVADLTNLLTSIDRQYQKFSRNLKYRTGGRLLVASVTSGSIDINLIPDLMTANIPFLMPLIDNAKLFLEFGKNLKSLFDFVRSKEAKVPLLTLNDCDDAKNIVAPVAKRGGVQIFNVIQGSDTKPIINITGDDAIIIFGAAENLRREIAEREFPAALGGADDDKNLSGPGQASLLKGTTLLAPASEIATDPPFISKEPPREQVQMTWSRLDHGEAKRSAGHSFDRGIIKEIDPKPRPVFFTGEMVNLKNQMLADGENPFRYVYLVDVEVSRMGAKVTSYRIVGHHGKTHLGS